MTIEIDEQKILKDILEFDNSVHNIIKRQVTENLVNQIESEIKETYFKNGWHGITDEIKQSVLEEIKEEQERIVKKILSDFYDSYRFGKKDITILKKLKELIAEN
jgi:predicted GNAT family acetyltransferase